MDRPSCKQPAVNRGQSSADNVRLDPTRLNFFSRVVFAAHDQFVFCSLPALCRAVLVVNNSTRGSFHDAADPRLRGAGRLDIECLRQRDQDRPSSPQRPEHHARAACSEALRGGPEGAKDPAGGDHYAVSFLLVHSREALLMVRSGVNDASPQSIRKASKCQFGGAGTGSNLRTGHISRFFLC